MFAYSGLTPEHVDKLAHQHSIYMTRWAWHPGEAGAALREGVGAIRMKSFGSIKTAWAAFKHGFYLTAQQRAPEQQAGRGATRSKQLGKKHGSFTMSFTRSTNPSGQRAPACARAFHREAPVWESFRWPACPCLAKGSSRHSSPAGSLPVAPLEVCYRHPPSGAVR